VPAFIFDLDGTLVDSVYQHVFAWNVALRTCGFELPMWRIHRKIGMSGALLLRSLETDLNLKMDDGTKKRLEKLHGEEFARLRSQIQPFKGTRELLQALKDNGVRFAIATSGGLEDVQPLIDMLELDDGVPVISKKDASTPKPDPGLFLIAAEKLRSPSHETIAVGDSVWDMLAAQRAHFLGIGLLTGGYGESEMTSAGAFRVYSDPGQMCAHLHEAGVVTAQT